MVWNYRSKTGLESKFGNVVPNALCPYGFSHRSQLERSVCGLVNLREKAGELEHLQHEDHLVICGPPGHSCPKKITYVADFKCRDKKSLEVFWIEAKGFANDTWPLKKNLFKHFGPGRLEVWKGTHARPFLDEVIIPLGAK